MKNINILYIVIVLLLVSNFLLIFNKSVPSLNIMNNNKTNFKNIAIARKYNDLVNHIGDANLIENDSNGFTNSVTWQQPLNQYNGPGKYGGLDYIRMSGYVTRKLHPIPADCFLIVGKYINVPDHLLGPIKFASETINIEQLFIPQIHNEVYENEGIKEVALVTGSCASITISSITVKFVEDMIDKYKFAVDINPLELYQEFRDEYDRRVFNYLCGGGIKPSIPWYNSDMFGEPTVYEGDFKECIKSPSM